MVADANGEETKEFIPQQDTNNLKEFMLNIVWSITELDTLYNFHEHRETKELILMGQEHYCNPYLQRRQFYEIN